LSTGAFASGEGKGSKGAAGLSVESFTDKTVVGRFKLSDGDYQIDLRFDLPLLGRDAPVERLTSIERGFCLKPAATENQ
jgi:hypothetical protein